jgi:hypothetical protein
VECKLALCIPGDKGQPGYMSSGKLSAGRGGTPHAAEPGQCSTGQPGQLDAWAFWTFEGYDRMYAEFFSVRN